jgi:predicted HTH domain antitoxin
MDSQIAVSYPSSLAYSLKMKDGEFEREIKVLSLVKLYELGKVSSGIAAKILDISRLDFFDLLALYQVSCFPDSEELAEDFNNA